MQNKVDAEGTEKEAIFDKFLCCCDNAELFGAAIAVAENKIPHLESTLEENAAEKKQLEADLEAHKAARAAAEGAIAKATTIREKDAAAFAKVSSDLKNNLAALASVIRQLSITMDMSLVDREMLASYLSGTRDSALASREIFDILKTIVGIENRATGHFTGDAIRNCSLQTAAPNTKMAQNSMLPTPSVTCSLVAAQRISNATSILAAPEPHRDWTADQNQLMLLPCSRMVGNFREAWFFKLETVR